MTQPTGPSRILPNLVVAAAVAAVAGGALYVGYGLLLRRDFHVICEAYSEGSVESLGDDPITEAYEISRYIEGNIFTHPARHAVRAASFARAEDHYELVRKAAVQSGWADWECPAMRDYFHEIDARSSAPAESPTDD